ncbi:MAG: 1,4-dihydroxy-2-naphthoate polyprenyltransferase [Bacteroidota bacterium]
MQKLKAWIISLRLRTLPLALSTIFMGSFLAAGENLFNIHVLVWASLTTLFLQILSNLANDYGDTRSGADNDDRQGPKRMIQSGKISLKQMKKAVIITSVLALISGSTLIIVSLEGHHLMAFVFFIMGISAIAAAIRYTVGKNPYGYRGLGDLYVFIFFGIMGVGGTFFLHTGSWQWPVLLPATAIGLFSTGVLNLNNIRDIESDRKIGKKTLPVLMGREKAAVYHLSLLTTGWIMIMMWTVLHAPQTKGWLLLLVLPVFIKNALTVFREEWPAQKLDKELRNLSLGTLLVVLLYGVQLVIF